jgi:hypothetical protein
MASSDRAWPVGTEGPTALVHDAPFQCCVSPPKLVITQQLAVEEQSIALTEMSTSGATRHEPPENCNNFDPIAKHADVHRHETPYRPLRTSGALARDHDLPFQRSMSEPTAGERPKSLAIPTAQHEVAEVQLIAFRRLSLLGPGDATTDHDLPS